MRRCRMVRRRGIKLLHEATVRSSIIPLVLWMSLSSGHERAFQVCQWHVVWPHSIPFGGSRSVEQKEHDGSVRSACACDCQQAAEADAFFYPNFRGWR